MQQQVGQAHRTVVSIHADASIWRAYEDAERRLHALLRQVVTMTILNDAELQRAATRLLTLPDLPLDDAVTTGLSLHSLQALAAHLGWSQRRLTALIGASPASIARARRQGQTLNQTVSQALAHLAVTVAAAETYFNELQTARRWLNTPRATLLDLTPLSFALTPGGANHLVLLLRRLEYGVYS